MTLPAAPSPAPGGAPRPNTGRLLGGAALIVLGVAWLLEALDVVDVPWDVFLPVGLIALGAILIANARTGARHRGLIALGVVLTVVLFLGSVISFPFAGGIGEKTAHPTTAAEAQERIELGVGELTVDLTDLPPDASSVSLVRARVGIGELTVEVAEGVAVRVEARASLGSVQVFDREESGFDVSVVSEPGGAAPELDLRLTVGIGEVVVHRG